jgi:hypothetical protein
MFCEYCVKKRLMGGAIYHLSHRAGLFSGAAAAENAAIRI